MKASILKPAQNGRNMEPEKNRVNTLRVVSRILGKGPELRTLVEARFYMARKSDGASPVHCSLWVHGDQYCSGYGKASGYGYHKESAALQFAIDSAGIRLTGDNYQSKPEDETATKPARIDGCGDTAMREAMREIAIAAGADPDCMLVE